VCQKKKKNLPQSNGQRQSHLVGPSGQKGKGKQTRSGDEEETNWVEKKKKGDQRKKVTKKLTERRGE